MIVSDKSATLEKADEISYKLVEIIANGSKEFECYDDPAENIYLSVHILGNLIAKIAIALQSYGSDIYGIQQLNPETTVEWIAAIANEHIKVNTGTMK